MLPLLVDVGRSLVARLLIDDGFVHHPKVVGLTPRDRWTWLELLCYCARYRTGGHVPSSIRQVVRGADGAFIARVFERGLLDEDVAGDGWKVHDWTIYNGSSVEKRVKAYLESHPESTANEVARDVAGRREVVLSEVARIRKTSGNSGSEGGSGEPDGNAGGTGSAGGSGTGSYARARAALTHTHQEHLATGGDSTPQAAPLDAATPAAVKPTRTTKERSQLVVCPVCEVKEGEPCVWPSGVAREHSHAERHAAAKGATPNPKPRAERCPDCEVGGGLHAADCPRAPKP